MASDRTLVPLSATISAYDYDLKILPDAPENDAVPAKPCYGIVTADALGCALTKKKLLYTVLTDACDGSSTINIKFYSADVIISEGGRKTRINCPNQDNRRELRELVVSCLERSC